MKVLSKFFRCSCVLLLALIVAVSAAIGVSAYDSVAALLRIDQVYNISRISENSDVGVNPNTTYALGFRFALDYFDNSTYYIEVTINKNSSESSTNIFSDNCVYANYTNNVQTSIDPYSGNIFNNLETYIIEDSSTITKYAILFNSENIPNDSYMTCFAYLLKNTSILSFSYINISAYYTIDENQTEFDIINQKLSQIISNQQSNIEEIQQSLTNIINNQIIQNNNWNTLINYGNNYNQIDSTLIGNLGTAEDQLSSAEGALENKSQSLKDSVASQWQTIQSTSKTFITNIAPAAAAVGTVTTQFMDAAPEEVKGLFVTIPLLIFIGWLIGRIRGD